MTDESTIVQMLAAAYEAAIEKGNGQEMRIDLQIQQKLFGGFGSGGRPPA